MHGRYLRGNATCRIPSSHVVIDCEARIEDIPGTPHQRQSLRLGCSIGWRRDRSGITRRSVCTFTDRQQWYDWLRGRLSTHRTTVIWAHNAPYDLSLIRWWDEWDCGAFIAQWYALEDPPTILSGTLWGRRVLVLDSLNWLQHSLERIGEWVGLKKGKVDFRRCDDETLGAYCYRDCEILERAVQAICDLVAEHDLGVFRPTAAGQSMQHYRHRFLYPGLCIPCDAEGEDRVQRHKEWERGGYYGGRTELFYRGEVSSATEELFERSDGRPTGPVTTLDVTGLYCSILAHQLLPSRVLDASSAPNPVSLRLCAERYGVIAECVVESDDTPYPVRLRDRTIYALGRYHTTLAGPELVCALQRGHVRSVVRATSYQLDPIARDYAEYWWDRRCDWTRQRVPILAALGKSMPNAWYGKWGQRTSSWAPAADMPLITDRYGEELRWYRWPDRRIVRPDTRAVCSPEGERLPAVTTQYRAVAGIVEQEIERVPAERSWPAIAAFVTAHARAAMDRFRRAAGERGTLYQCVDTLHVTPSGLAGLSACDMIRPDTLGYLRETGRYDTVQYYGINLMRIDGKLIAAGLSRLHRELTDGTITATTFEGLAQLLSREPDGSVYVTDRTWHPDYRYRHSVVGADGWCVPHRLPEGGQ